MTQTSNILDLLERLRDPLSRRQHSDCLEAAATIEALQSENTWLQQTIKGGAQSLDNAYDALIGLDTATVENFAEIIQDDDEQ